MEKPHTKPKCKSMLPTLLKGIGVYKFYEKWLEDGITSEELPEHVGIILDGNRRWGFEMYGERLDGHFYGGGRLVKTS